MVFKTVYPELTTFSVPRRVLAVGPRASSLSFAAEEATAIRTEGQDENRDFHLGHALFAWVVRRETKQIRFDVYASLVVAPSLAPAWKNAVRA